MNKPENSLPKINDDQGTSQGVFLSKRLLLFSGGGIAAVLCFMALVGFGFMLGRSEGGDFSAEQITPSDQPTAVSAAITTPPTEAAIPVTDTPISAPSPTATLPAPEFGPILFASRFNDDGEPSAPTDTFLEGVTKIYAVFDYQNMLAVYTWERIWYLDGTEVLQSQDVWQSEMQGQYDYFLDTGGDALPPGEWSLELYVEGELLTEGTFSIEPKKITRTPTPMPTSKAVSTPTSTPVPVATSAPVVHRTYQILFSRWEGNAHNLYTADTNGNNVQLLLTHAAGPSWSLDKQRLFFFGEQGVTQQKRDGKPGCEFGTISDGLVAIDVMSPLGDICGVQAGAWFCDREKVELQTEPSDVCTAGNISIYQNLDWKMGTARWAAASPDGDAIAFDAKPGGDYRIYFRAMLGTSQQFRYELVGEQGSWSPDGQRMVYRSGRDNKVGLWHSNRNDSDHRLITNDGSDAFPTWSPDGGAIAFSRRRYGNVDIFTVNTDGTNLKRLTDDPGHDTLPVYTPNGQIIFRSDRSGSWGIYKMNGNGSGQTLIIPHADVGPDWVYSKMDVR